MKKSELHIRIEDSLKAKAIKAALRLKLTLSEYIRKLLKDNND